MHLISQLNIKLKSLTKFYVRYLVDKHVVSFLHTIRSPQQIKLLEVGPRPSRWYELFKDKFSIISIDIDPESQADYIMDVCNMKEFEDESFDLVIMVEVLEHVHNPSLAIDEIHRVLKPGGQLLLTTPFLFPIHDAPNDFFRFTKFGLKKILNIFDQVRVETFDYFFVSIWILISRLHMNQSKIKQLLGYLIYILFLPFLPLCILLDFFTRFDSYSSRYLSIGRKK